MGGFSPEKAKAFLELCEKQKRGYTMNEFKMMGDPAFAAIQKMELAAIKRIIAGKNKELGFTGIAHHISKAGGYSTMRTSYMSGGTAVGIKSHSTLSNNSRIGSPMDMASLKFFNTKAQSEEFLAMHGGYSMGFDAAKKREMSFYTNRKDQYPMDAFFHSHEHWDHTKGLPNLVAKRMINFLITNDAILTSKTMKNVAKNLAEAGYDSEQIVAVGFGRDSLRRFYIGDEEPDFELPLSEYSGMVIETLGPQHMFTASGSTTTNNNSLITKITYGENKVLCLGDISNVGLRELFKYADEYEKQTGVNILKCDVLKLSHHGSDDCISEELLRRTQPKACVVSCGNSPSHPGPEALNLLRNHIQDGKPSPIPLFRTARSGEIDILFQSKSTIHIKEEFPTNVTNLDVMYSENNQPNNEVKGRLTPKIQTATKNDIETLNQGTPPSSAMPDLGVAIKT